MSATYDTYLKTVDQRALEAGFELREDAPSTLLTDRIYHRRQVSLTKFGMLDSFAMVVFVPADDSLNTGWIHEFSRISFEYALARKSWFPRGLFGALEVFPLVVANSVSEEVRSFMEEEYLPKHWSAFEFPSVLDLSARKLSFYKTSPAWGGAYFPGFRHTVEELYSP